MKKTKDMTEKEWKTYSAVKLSEIQYDSLRMRGVPEGLARWRVNGELEDRLAEINATTSEELKAEFDAEARAEGLPDRIIPRDAYAYRAKGRESTFSINGKSVNFAEFLAHASRNGYNPTVLENAIVKAPKASRKVTSSAITFTEDSPDTEVKKDE